MADVHIVCVREDEPQAKALADMFEAAGFSIGGAPSNDGALRSSGAGVIVWSQSSIRSRPFLDAAQRVINAGKAVVASLIEPPPPSSIGSSQAFDLSRWNGDPNDPALDPLFFAVDRMVSTARADVGAGGAQAASAPAYEEPPPARAAPQQPAYQSQGDLGTEAEYWRSIRDSNDPADYMEYLSRFGPKGTFSEVAELKLKQLTGAAPAARAAPMRPAAPTPAPAPALRPTRPAPQRAEAPPAAPRRADPPPPRRQDPVPPPRRMDFNRGGGFDDRADAYEPLPRESGPMRAFILIALLGGAALAGGLYFGGGLPSIGGGEAQTEQQAADYGAADYATPPADYDGLAAEGQDNVSLQDAASTPAPAPQRETRREPRAEPERTTQTASQSQQDTAVPAPRTSWNDGGQTATGASGPASLQPGSNDAASAPNTVVPLRPPTQTPTQTASNNTRTAAATPQRTQPAGTVSFAQRPSARRISDLYPSRALREGVGGRVELSCVVQPSLSLSCSVASETPSGQGFGRAALSASSSYRARPLLSDGSTAVGARTRVAFNFQAPQ